MEDTIFIHSDNVNEIKNLLVNQFGFNYEGDDYLILEKYLKIRFLYDENTPQFVNNYLQQHGLSDSTEFYNLVNIAEFHLELTVYHLNDMLLLNYALIKHIFKAVSQLLNNKLVINLNGIKFYYYDNGKLTMKFKDYRRS